MTAVEVTKFIAIMFTRLIHGSKHPYDNLINALVEQRLVGKSPCFYKSLFLSGNPADKRYYKLYATGALLSNLM